MIALRLLALLSSFLVLILPAFVLSDVGIDGISGMTGATALLGLALASASFVYIGMAGDHMRRNARARMQGAILLAVPIVGSLVLLATRKDASLLWAAGIVLMFSLVLFLGFVFPTIEARQRPMRRRERLV